MLSIGLAIGTSEQVKNGIGVHIYELNEAQMIDSQKVSVIVKPNQNFANFTNRHFGPVYGCVRNPGTARGFTGRFCLQCLLIDPTTEPKVFTNFAHQFVDNLLLTVTKISILLQYLQIFPIRRFKTACYVLLGIVTAYGVWTLFGNMFMCTPVEFFWNKTIPGGKCLNQFAVWFLNAGVNIVQDFAILILPMPVLRSLSIQKGQKRALMVMFALGGL